MVHLSTFNLFWRVVLRDSPNEHTSGAEFLAISTNFHMHILRAVQVKPVFPDPGNCRPVLQLLSLAFSDWPSTCVNLHLSFCQTFATYRHHDVKHGKTIDKMNKQMNKRNRAYIIPGKSCKLPYNQDTLYQDAIQSRCLVPRWPKFFWFVLGIS